MIATQEFLTKQMTLDLLNLECEFRLHDIESCRLMDFFMSIQTFCKKNKIQTPDLKYWDQFLDTLYYDELAKLYKITKFYLSDYPDIAPYFSLKDIPTRDTDEN